MPPGIIDYNSMVNGLLSLVADKQNPLSRTLEPGMGLTEGGRGYQGTATPQALPHAGEPCFACGKKLGKNPALADTRDGQVSYVGQECYKHIKNAGEEGYQPPKGGPRLWTLPK